MMQPSDARLRMEEWLTRRRVAYRSSREHIEVPALSGDGFTVGLRCGDGVFTVFFDVWHEHFDTEQDALNWFAFGLSDACRLQVEYRGQTAVTWTVQSRDRTGWANIGEVGLLLVPFWRPTHIVYRQNRVLESSSAEGP
jgi:hypothetical protein